MLPVQGFKLSMHSPGALVRGTGKSRYKDSQPVASWPIRDPDMIQMQLGCVFQCFRGLHRAGPPRVH